MSSIQKLQDIYLIHTKNIFNTPVALELLNKEIDIVSTIEYFLNEKSGNKFKIELLMIPNWATKNKSYVVFCDKYTHIKIKRTLI